MTQLLIHMIPPEVKEGLRLRARLHARGLEPEAREILREAVRANDGPGLGTRIDARFRNLDLRPVELAFEVRGDWGFGEHARRQAPGREATA